MAKILLAEDDRLLSERIVDWLKFEHHSVENVDNGTEAMERLRIYEYELVILDWNLPGMSGIDVCQNYRIKKGSAPILILTANDTIAHKETGFNSGADDYLTKPFHMKELALRIRSLLRRPPTIANNILAIGSVTLDSASGKVTVDGEVVHLIPKEFALLEFLMRHSNQIFGAEALLERVWPSEIDFTAGTVRSHISRLRKKIENLRHDTDFENTTWHWIHDRSSAS